jgi:hypothetical protein
MTNLSPQAQAIIDAFYREVPPNYEQGGLVAVLRCLIDECSEVRGTGRVDKKSQVVSVKTLMELATELGAN